MDKEITYITNLPIPPKKIINLNTNSYSLEKKNKKITQHHTRRIQTQEGDEKECYTIILHTDSYNSTLSH